MPSLQRVPTKSGGLMASVAGEVRLEAGQVGGGVYVAEGGFLHWDGGDGFAVQPVAGGSFAVLECLGELGGSGLGQEQGGVLAAAGDGNAGGARLATGGG